MTSQSWESLWADDTNPKWLLSNLLTPFLIEAKRTDKDLNLSYHIKRKIPLWIVFVLASSID